MGLKETEQCGAIAVLKEIADVLRMDATIEDQVSQETVMIFFHPAKTLKEAKLVGGFNSSEKY